MKIFRKKKKKENLEMSKVVPSHNVEFNREEDGTITLLKPKFTSKFSQKFIIPKMKYPYYQIHLDEIGTAVWNSIDGKTDALRIGEKIREELGEKIEPVYERLGMFLAKLKNENFIKW